MKTTPTIDDDAAPMPARLRKSRRPTKPREPFRTRSADLGRVLIGSVDNIAEVLAVAEGEGFR